MTISILHTLFVYLVTLHLADTGCVYHDLFNNVFCVFIHVALSPGHSNHLRWEWPGDETSVFSDLVL